MHRGIAKERRDWFHGHQRYSVYHFSVSTQGTTQDFILEGLQPLQKASSAATSVPSVVTSGLQDYRQQSDTTFWQQQMCLSQNDSWHPKEGNQIIAAAGSCLVNVLLVCRAGMEEKKVCCVISHFWYVGDVCLCSCGCFYFLISFRVANFSIGSAVKESQCKNCASKNHKSISIKGIESVIDRQHSIICTSILFKDCTNKKLPCVITPPRNTLWLETTRGHIKEMNL